MKVYVAARFHEKERVKEIYTSLESQGHTITFDWTTCTPHLTHESKVRCAARTVEAIKECDIFIYISNPEIGAGSSTEFGGALLCNALQAKPLLYTVGEHLDKNFFLYHPTVIAKNTIDEVLCELQSL